jgi:hypothetical protein
MVSRKTLLASVLLALTSALGCQMLQSSATVDVPTAETSEDEALSKSVLDRLLMDKKVDLTGIRVVSNDGKVFLSGTVKSLDAREQAIKIVWTSPRSQRREQSPSAKIISTATQAIQDSKSVQALSGRRDHEKQRRSHDTVERAGKSGVS